MSSSSAAAIKRWDLAASLTALSEQALHPKRPVLVRRGRIELKRVERSHKRIPLLGVAGAGEYPTPRPQMLARANSSAGRQRLYRLTDLGVASRLTTLVSMRNLSGDLGPPPCHRR